MDEDAAIAEQGPAGYDGDDAIATRASISDLSFFTHNRFNNRGKRVLTQQDKDTNRDGRSP
jgi:hypothetical protein